MEINSGRGDIPEVHLSPSQTLQKRVAELEALCKPPPEVTEQFILFFNSIEFGAVNEMWERLGLDAVVERFGEERRFHLTRAEEVIARSLDEEESSPGRDGGVRLLQIMKYEETPASTSPQEEYYRAARIALEESAELELLHMLDTVGITQLVVPDYDEFTGRTLRGCKVIGLTAGVQWYGKTNIYGAGVELQLSLELDDEGEDSIFVCMTVDEAGRVCSKLIFPELLETGYEGHGAKTVDLNTEQTQLLSAVITQLERSGVVSMAPQYAGAWIGL